MSFWNPEKILNEQIPTYPPLDIGKGSWVFISDPHWNSKGGQNDFEKNKVMFYYVMMPYYIRREFSGVGVGDIADLIEADWYDIYAYNKAMIDEFCAKLLKVWILGNHDRKADKLPDIHSSVFFCKGLRLFFGDEEIGFSTHGDLIDVFNAGGDVTSIVNWVVRYIWVFWQKITNRRVASPARDIEMANTLDNTLMKYCKKNKTKMIAGHTHESHYDVFSGGGMYLNCGSWVKMGGGQTVEIVDRKIRRVNWVYDSSGKPIREVYNGYYTTYEQI